MEHYLIRNCLIILAFLRTKVKKYMSSFPSSGKYPLNVHHFTDGHFDFNGGTHFKIIHFMFGF